MLATPRRFLALAVLALTASPAAAWAPRSADVASLAFPPTAARLESPRLIARIQPQVSSDWSELCFELAQDAAPTASRGIASLDWCVSFDGADLRLDCEAAPFAACSSTAPGCQVHARVDADPLSPAGLAGPLGCISYRPASGASEIRVDLLAARDRSGNPAWVVVDRHPTWLEAAPGDCNDDLGLDQNDAPAVLARLAARGRGAMPAGGCDCNRDRRIDVADAACAIVGGLGPANGPGPAGAVSGPLLDLADRVPAAPGGPAVIPLSFAQGGPDGAAGGPDDITAFSVCVTYDESRLSFDTSDVDGDGIPDAVRFLVPDSHMGFVQIDLDDPTCRIFLAAIDLALPMGVLAPGAVAEIEFVLDELTPPGTEIGVGCGDPLALSFSDTTGTSQPGSCDGGSFLAGCVSDEDCDDGVFCNGAETCGPEGECEPGVLPVIDDEVDCTIDTCDEATDTVLHEPSNAFCDDGLFCNGAEACDAVLDCVPGAPPVVDDEVDCTIDTCDEATDTVLHEPSNAFCDDGLFCNGAEACDAVLDCVPGAPPVVDDEVDCTIDTCDEATDTVLHEPSNAFCDDGLFCNGAEACDPVLDCVPGAPPVVDDEVDCTIDTCDEATDTVLHEPSNAFCDDGLFCNGAEACDPVLDCVPGAPPVVDDEVDCTIDTCDEATDTVLHEPSNAFCDDGLFCNGAEACDPVLDCVPGAPPVVDDEVDCTIDTCDEATDTVLHEPSNAFCDDGLFCNGAEACDAVLDCVPGAPPVVDDEVDCTIDTCDEATDTVLHEPSNAFCDDGLFCNGAEACDPVLDCVPGAPPVVDDEVDCTIDTCDEATDTVLHEPSNAFCDDGLFCNGAEACDPVLDCVPGAPPVVDDEVDCTIDTCDEATDTVLHEPSNAFCDDGLFCNGAETCDPVLDCVPGAPPVVDDEVDCTIDTCDEATDTVLHEPSNAFCDDGLFCNGAEACDPVLDCVPGAPPLVDDEVDCTIDTCDEATDTVLHEPSNAFCDDGLFCNGAERCDAVLDCVAGTRPVVGDGVTCTIDRCDERTDTVVHEPSDAICDDGDPTNGAEVCDPEEGCQPGTCSGPPFTICHHPPGNPDNARTITVGSARSLAAHLSHGDTCGACPARPPKGRSR